MNVKHKVQIVEADAITTAPQLLADNQQEAISIIYTYAGDFYSHGGKKLFAPLWRTLQFFNCPLSYSQALKAYNNAFQQLSGVFGRDSRNLRKASNLSL